jgi:hypothetical protein
MPESDDEQSDAESDRTVRQSEEQSEAMQYMDELSEGGCVQNDCGRDGMIGFDVVRSKQSFLLFG